ncbi:hypothetical protein [Rubripirellula obstinata]|uniref:hypothetical protein n=1 Tax=Rubripirellula obstinata TaxID=406547 RepID=UPI00122D1C71|nr:hypothetical protein [Rubripirellula obstinata]
MSQTLEIIMKSPLLLSLFFACFLSPTLVRGDLVINPDAFATYRNQDASGFQFAFNNTFQSNNFPSFGSFGVEDRAVGEFDISSLSSSVAAATLNLNLTVNSGDTSIPLNYDLFVFSGDGVVNASSTADVAAGVLADSFVISSEPTGSVIQIDVTSQLNQLIANGDNFAGFNLGFNGSEPPADRFTRLSNFSDGTNNVPTLSITSVPEPSSFILVAIPMFFLALNRRRGITNG